MVIDWLEVAARWLHVIAAVVWIGGSFYFIRLDYGLKHHNDLPDGVRGDHWTVHGGGFYHSMKYLVAPANLPADLKWTRWDSYVTFLSGLALLIIVYYIEADLFLIDRNVMDLTPVQAAGISFGSLVLAWLIYEVLCRSRLGRHDVALGVIVYLFMVALTFAFTNIFSGRGALNQIGVIVGTIMVANAFGVIHPNQRKAIVALQQGKKPDPERTRQAGQRSIHNNYLALPVLFLMISNHFPAVFATKYNWVIVAVILALGPIMRHYFNTRHAGRGNAWWTWGAVAAGALLIAWLTTLGPRTSVPGDADAYDTSAVTFGQVQEVVAVHCSMCHAQEPLWPSLSRAAGGVHLDTADHIARNARLIGRSAVWSSSMPPGNLTGMTDEERTLIGAWLDAGAPQ